MAPLLLAGLLLVAGGAPQASRHSDARMLWDASHVLRFYENGQQGFCSAFPIENSSKGTWFFTAGHCALTNNSYSIATGDYKWRKAKLAYTDPELDLAILFVGGYQVPSLKLGRTPELGEVISVVSVLRGLYDVGEASGLPMQEPPYTLVASIVSYQGMSGSAVYCIEQRAVCGYVIGHFVDTPYAAVAPISNIKGTPWGKLLP